jgi:hypothetical protein
MIKIYSIKDHISADEAYKSGFLAGIGEVLKIIKGKRDCKTAELLIRKIARTEIMKG